MVLNLFVKRQKKVAEERHIIKRGRAKDISILNETMLVILTLGR